MPILTLIAAAALAGTPATGTEAPPVAPVAASDAPSGTVYRLSPDEIAKIAPKPAGDPKLAYDPLFDRSLFGADEAPPRDRRPHGEVGMFVGSGGSRGVFGTTTVPLGDTGFASFSFEDSNYGNRRYRRR